MAEKIYINNNEIKEINTPISRWVGNLMNGH
jgi:hypothetical protein